MFTAAAGINITINSRLGVSPISAFPYALSLVSRFSMGTCVFFTFVIFVLLQIIILRKDFKLISLLQLVLSTIFGFFMDLSAWLVMDFRIPSYPGQLMMLATGIVVIALGLTFYLVCDVMIMPVEALNFAISTKTGVPFYKVKIAMDCGYVALAAVIMLAGLGETVNIREGTIISAVLAGKTYALFSRFISQWETNLCFGPNGNLKIKKHER
jgi:uncharacterized membrane protein YczE